MKTRGIKFLESKKIDFEILEYEHKKKGAEYAAKVLNVPLNKMIKTIVIKSSNDNFYFALMPGDKEISFKKLAKLIGVKKVELATPDEANRITGYMVGGISPFGSKKQLKVYIDDSLTQYNTIYINAGARGVILKLKFNDLKILLSPITGDIKK